MAVEGVRQELEMLIDRERERLGREGLDKLRGREWWELTRAEQWVFGLSLADMGHTGPVYAAYQWLVLVPDAFPDDPLRMRALAVLPWLTQDTTSLREFQRFAALFGVSNRVAAAYMAKIEWLEVRAGLVTYADEMAEPAVKRPPHDDPGEDDMPF